MRKRIITPRTMLYSMVVVALLTAYLVGGRQPAGAAPYIADGRYQLFPAALLGIDSPGGIVIFDSEKGVARQWVENTVTTYDFTDHRQIPEKRTYREQ